jgi:hypothetical protein
MDEEKKVMEKRSSFRGWKERNKDRMHKKRKTIGILITISIFFAMIIYPDASKIDNNNENNISDHNISGNNISLSIGKNNTTVSPVKQNKTLSSNPKNKSNTKIVNTSKNNTNISQSIVIGKIGVPLISNGFEITVKSVTTTEIRMSVWIIVRNKDNYEKPFKLGPGTIVLDNIGQQYESINVKRSAQISQTNLATNAMREGAVFFENLKDGRTPKKLTLNINNQKVEFILDNKSN